MVILTVNWPKIWLLAALADGGICARAIYVYPFTFFLRKLFERQMITERRWSWGKTKSDPKGRRAVQVLIGMSRSDLAGGGGQIARN